jgi:AI-2 transport protein TqsA
MKDNLPFPLLRVVQGTAYTVIILLGVRASSPILGPLLFGLMLSYALVSFPLWLMERLKLSKSGAVGVTVIALATTGLSLVLAMQIGITRMATRLPIYAQRLASLAELVTGFLIAHGVEPTSFSLKRVLTIERLREIALSIVPTAWEIIFTSFLVVLLALLLAIEMLPDAGAKRSPIGELLSKHGSYSKRYMAVTVKSGGINSLMNMVFMLAIGVDGAILWTLLYFFLNFIPNVGFTIALLPPTITTLLMYGWKKGLAVAVGLIITNLIVDNIVTPYFAKRSLKVSFLELTLSLVAWSLLLGLIGAIIAIPLTVALRDFFAEKWAKGQLDMGLQDNLSRL